MTNTDTQQAVPEGPTDVGPLLKLIAIGIGGFTLWSAGPGIATDHVRLSVFLLAVWTFIFLSHDARRRFRKPEFPLPGVVLGLITAAALVGLSTMAPALFAGEAVPITLAVVVLALFVATFFVKGASNVALAAIGALVLWYTYANYLDLVNRAGAWTPEDAFVAGTATLLCLEVARRGLGLAIPIIAVLAMGYAYFGQYMPYDVAHRGVSMERMVNYILYSQEGIFGIMTSVMANYVFVFILLGAFMTKSGMGRFFIEFPMAIAGRSAGGPAKVAVFSSGIFGSISGSSLANIVSTGTFTIPLMKRVGFRPAVAGAVENSASLGGQLLPPVMGAGVFVMAEITGIAYAEIIAVAAAPALLYFASLILIVHFEAKRSGIGGVPEEEAMAPMAVLRAGWFHVVPFAVLVACLVAGYSPDRSALASILTILIINWIRYGLAKMQGTTPPGTFLGFKGIAEAMTDGMRNAVAIGGIAASVGIIVGMIALTGFGLKMGLLIVGATDGSLFMTLVLIALTSLILGMALPITAAYLVLVVIAAPALEQLGVPLIAAHMIVFWLSQDSNITPPVCLGAFVAASIAKAGPWETAWLSFRFAKMLYVMPLLFAYTPILFTGESSVALWTICTATLGTIAFAGWTMKYLRQKTTRLTSYILAATAFALFFPAEQGIVGNIPGYAANIAGIVVLAAVLFFNRDNPSPNRPRKPPDMSPSDTIPLCAGPDPDTRGPGFEMPENACDTHFHIFPACSEHMMTPRRSYTPPVASLEMYNTMSACLGTSRGVLIQPSVYAEDNSALVAATAADPDRLRGVVTVTSAITDQELEDFHAAGVRGIRVNIVDSGGMPFRDLSEAWEFTSRIAGLGWHIELLAHVEQIDDIDAALKRSKVPVIFGHLGYTKTSIGVGDPGYQRFLGCIAEGRCWVKLTGAYRISGRDAVPYDDVTPMAEALLAANPDRIVWGSDWPHPRHPGVMPNDGALLDQLADWGADAEMRHKILVTNPAGFYGF